MPQEGKRIAFLLGLDVDFNPVSVTGVGCGQSNQSRYPNAN